MLAGLDFSQTAPALVTINDQNQLDVLKINTKKFKKDYKARNFYVLDVIAERLKTVDTLVIEDYAFAACGRITAIAEMVGVIKYSFKGEIIMISPNSLKKALTGKGNATKETMIKTIKEKYNIPIPDDDDIADAIALAFIGKGIITAKQRIW